MNRLIVFLVLSILISCNDFPDNYPPNCAITSPNDGSEFFVGDTVEIVVDAWDWEDDFISVNLIITSYGPVEFTSNNSYRYEWNTEGFESGEYYIEASAIDLGGSGLWCTGEISIILKEKTAVTD